MANNFQITALNQQGVATVLHPESNADQVLPGTSTKVPLRTEITKWNERADEVEIAREGKANLKEKIDDVVTKLTGTITTVRTNLEETISLLDSKTTAEDARLLGRMDGIKTNLQTQIDVWNNFKANGGTIGGVLTAKAPIKVEKDWSGFEMWNTSKSDFIRLVPDPSNMNLQIQSMRNGEPKANMVIAKNSIYPFGDNPSTLGVDVAPWEDVYLSGINKSTNGYTKLPNGMIMQWGNYGEPSASSEHREIRYPITFPNKPVTVMVVGQYGLSRDNYWTVASVGSQTLFHAYKANRTDQKDGFYWFAIGY